MKKKKKKKKKRKRKVGERHTFPARLDSTEARLELHNRRSYPPRLSITILSLHLAFFPPSPFPLRAIYKHLLQIYSCSKCPLPRPREHHTPHFIVPLNLLKDIFERGKHGSREGIQLFLPVDLDMQDMLRGETEAELRI